jgi:hypothetical protein
MRRWDDNIKMDFKAVRYENVDWIHVADYRVQWQPDVNMVTNLRFLQKSREFCNRLCGTT